MFWLTQLITLSIFTYLQFYCLFLYFALIHPMTSKERTSKSHNPGSFRISKLAPKVLPSPVNHSQLNKTHSHSKYLFLDVPKTNQLYATKSDFQDNGSAKSSQNDLSDRQRDIDESAVENLIQLLMSKGPKFKETITANGEQMGAWILNSQALKIKTHNILQKLVDQRRLGVDLKGMNTAIINEIEKGLMNTLSFEATMYQKQKDFASYKNQITVSLQEYKADLIKQIQAINVN